MTGTGGNCGAAHEKMVGDVAAINAKLDALYGTQTRMHIENQGNFKELFSISRQHTESIVSLNTTVKNGIASNVRDILSILDGFKDWKANIKSVLCVLVGAVTVLILVHADAALKYLGKITG